MRLFRCALALSFTSVLAFGQTGTISPFAGLQSLGAGYTGDTGLATAAQLNAPTGLAVDSAGNVYISDFNNNVVRMVSASTGLISTYAGSGTAGFFGDGLAAIGAQLSAPMGLAVDSAGNLYIADSGNNRIRKVSSTGFMSTVAGSASAGSAGDGSTATLAQLNDPTGVAVDSTGNLYIADAANHRIREVTSGIISTLAGGGTAGFGGDGTAAANALFYFPKALAVDSTNNLYIADSGNNRIRKISNGVITTVAGNGSAAFAGDNGTATNASLNTPLGVAVDTNGNIYIADSGNNVVRKVSNGVITTVAGTSAIGFAGDNGPATSAILHTPYAVAVSPNGGSTYIADTNNNVVRVITNTFVTGVIPHFAAGATYVTGFYLVNTSAQAAGFSLSFYDSTGAPLSVPIANAAAATSITAVIPASGTAYYEIGNISANPGLTGSVVITTTASVSVQALIRHLSPTGVYYETAVPSTTGNLEIRTAFDDTTFTPTASQIYTGFAVTNIDTVNSASVTCIAKDNTGTLIPNALPILTLPPRGHGAGVVFPALYGKQGTIDCVSTTKIGVIALRSLGSEALSTLPIIPIK